MNFLGIKFKKIEYIVPALVLVLVLVGFVALTIATASPFTGEELTFGEIMANLDFSIVGLQAIFFVIPADYNRKRGGCNCYPRYSVNIHIIY